MQTDARGRTERRCGGRRSDAEASGGACAERRLPESRNTLNRRRFESEFQLFAPSRGVAVRPTTRGRRRWAGVTWGSQNVARTPSENLNSQASTTRRLRSARRRRGVSSDRLHWNVFGKEAPMLQTIEAQIDGTGPVQLSGTTRTSP